MFGHQDDQHDDNQQPQHDGAAEHDEAQHDEHANPALPTDVGSFGAPSGDTADTPTDDAGLASEPVSTPAAAAHDDLLDSGPANDLLDIKQQALQQLSPLVDHLDQSPEEKFRTTMMMIQASDNQALVKVAYEAAKQITDEKAKAQALLDIVNEINYFTHQGEASS